MLLPAAAVLVGAAQAEPDVWSHLSTFVLPQALPTTLLLVAGVTALAVGLGVSWAWLTTVYEFPGRRVFVVALLLPLAMPAYVLAFIYSDWIAYPSALPTAWRAVGWGEFPLQPGLGLAILTLALSLYPYVYGVVRQAFVGQGQQLFEAGRTLGARRGRLIRRITLPLALPWIAGSALLVAMETMADYATVAIFNVDTLTTAVFTTWFSLYSKATALKVAGLLLFLVLVLAGLERLVHRRQFRSNARNHQPLTRRVLTGWRGWSVSAGCTAFLGLVLVGPLLQLGLWQEPEMWARRTEWLDLAARSLGLSLSAAVGVTALALALAFAVRWRVQVGAVTLSRWATFGYAFPGVVLGVGLYWPLVQLDYWLTDRLWDLGFRVDTLLQSGVTLLMLGYAARFLAVAHKPVAAAVDRLTPAHEDSARLLGVQGLPLARRLYWPLLSGGLVTAVLLVFLDVLKEIPMTLLMRPVGWETLATKVFQFTLEGQWQQAATPALLLVLVSIPPVVWLSLTLWREEPHS